MTWKSIEDDELILCQQMVRWIETARKYREPDWLPIYPDMMKSALFERIRSGLEPLEYPPPVGYSCPWYAVVEDRGPHVVCIPIRTIDMFFYASWDPQGMSRPITPHGDGSIDDPMIRTLFPRDGSETFVTIFQSLYRIVERKDEWNYVIQDARKDTPYRFRLWWDAEYMSPHGGLPKPCGAWLMRNVEFEPKAA